MHKWIGPIHMLVTAVAIAKCSFICAKVHRDKVLRHWNWGWNWACGWEYVLPSPYVHLCKISSR